MQRILKVIATMLPLITVGAAQDQTLGIPGGVPKLPGSMSGLTKKEGVASSADYKAGLPKKVTSKFGDTLFDAADRLAIINLFGAYAQSYDSGNVEQFRSLFTENTDYKYVHGEHVYVNGIDETVREVVERTQAFAKQKDQRRHSLSSFAFTSQTATEARGQLYFQVASTKNAGAPLMALTGRYEFTAVKQGDVWKFSRWVAHSDSPLG